MNERKTENIIRNKLRILGYFDNQEILVEEQKSDNGIINNLLSKASKSGAGAGYPEFIIRKNNSDVIIIIECKASVKNHESDKKNLPKDFAVDGALHYASFLKNKFHIVAIAISGESENNLKLSVFQWNKNEKRFFPKKYSNINSYDDFYSLFHANDNVILSEAELLSYAKNLHDEMRDEAKLKEAEKPLLVGALLLALDNGDFTKEYPAITNPKKLALRIIEAIKDGLLNANIPLNKIETLEREFGFISTHTYLTKGKIDKENPSHNNNTLHKFLIDIHQKVYPFIKKTNNIDLIGQFYSEFLRYSGGDGKGLGIVLTPTHITDLFCELAEVNKNSKVIDICAGTGGFLISAMEYMLSGDPTVSEIDNIYKNNLVGVETQTNMFALACANMIIRGDGKTNLIQKNCFNMDAAELKKYNCNIGMINPPYSQKKEGEEELSFVKKMLNILTVGGTGIAIIPQSCVMLSNKQNNAIKQDILKHHTLKAVMSMPDELFGDGASAVTCVVVFEAHKPHNPNKSSWFGYFKNDGFEKIRNKGRIDYKKLYKNKIKKEWLYLYFNRTEKLGFSVLKNVSEKDEWLVESYMKTDYGTLTKNLFENSIKEYITYRFYNNLAKLVSVKPKNSAEMKFDAKKWKTFTIDKLFDVTGSKTTPKRNLQEIGKGIYPYITTSSINNGVEGFYDYYTDEGNILIIDSAVKGVCSYQSQKFSASDHVEKLIPRFKLNPYLAMFFVTLINLEQYRYSYGRKFNQTRIIETEIMLPADIHGNPDFKFMEDYIKSLQYSDSIL
ncbi:N-6 DNA methylase [Patescibacteria group bacterium]|nr:N-6 DNA methylase [Patescibacteria group bacterium]MBU4579828.1 N-6 DNA methylase [Patescibacteria group bacterium]